jgi:cytochrome c biogenesis protein CcdA
MSPIAKKTFKYMVMDFISVFTFIGVLFGSIFIIAVYPKIALAIVGGLLVLILIALWISNAYDRAETDIEKNERKKYET